MIDREPVPGAPSHLVDRATRLFRYLAEVQQLRISPIRTVERYKSDGAVLWLSDLSGHAAATIANIEGAPAPGDPVVAVDRVPRTSPPTPAELLSPWLTGPCDAPDRQPALQEEPPEFDPADDAAPSELRSAAPQPRPLDDYPEVVAAFHEWLPRWQAWAERERGDRKVREAYTQLFSAYQKVAGNPETYETVLSVGCLAWQPPGHEPVRRHLITVPAEIRFDDGTGQIMIEPAPSGRPTLELDMLDPGLTGSKDLQRVRSEVEELESHPLDRDALGPLVRRVVHSLDADGGYRDADDPPPPGRHAVAAFAPAVILRTRSRQGFVEAFQTIVEQLEESGEVHDGLLPLVDPDHQPSARPDTADGAMVTVDDELYLPLPVNDRQEQIIRQVDSTAQTLVQGPPGTGKTHTVAALLSHLLAQGKRVLVTAQTDRALKEVRDKLPGPIQALSVAVLGTSRADMSNLKTAVEQIGAAAGEHDRIRVEKEIEQCLAKLDELSRRRADLYRQLIDAREDEVREHQHGDTGGTLAAIAQEYQAQADRFDWLPQYVEVGPDSEPPLSDHEIQEWYAYLCDSALRADEAESRQRTLDPATAPAPDEFAALVASEASASRADQEHERQQHHPAFPEIRGLDPVDRRELQERLQALAEQADTLARRREAWMGEALTDVLSGRALTWQGRAGQIADLTGRAESLVAQLDPRTEVTITSDDRGPLVNLATTLRDHLQTGGKLKTGPDGTPRVGALSARAVRHAQPLFDHVRVDGVPPTTMAHLSAFITWVEVEQLLSALDRAWPATVHVPDEDTHTERLQWHRTELEQLQRLLHLAEQLDAESARLAELRLPPPDWNDLSAVRDYADLVDSAAAADALAEAQAPLQRLEETTADAAVWDDATPALVELRTAVRDRDPNRYAPAHQRLQRLARVRDLTGRRDELAARLSAAAPALREAAEQTAGDPRWSGRLAALAAAWRWAATGAWLRGRDVVDANAVQAELQETDQRIRRQVETLAATRAWGHAVSGERLTGKARADLAQYARLVQKQGKGTGKYAAQRQGEIRAAMDRCRPAVPVWIMPTYRIVEQFQVRPDMFDVVIVDEASQTGLEAAFLQYLAPTVVVIGDDKQVSPAAVGVNQQQLRDLARRYLSDDPYLATWHDPQTSMFDLAKERFGGRLVLVEHRRCFPEIIGFSNEIAYEPEKIRLLPVRQYGADRLEPIRPVLVPDGYIRGSAQKINPSEADAVVDQIEKCLADPRYDGRTFGVISLLGKAQAFEIEKRLLDRIPPEEWRARDLRCGDSADFQGSERDVMFLSMVVAATEGQRNAPLTREQYVQRFNVAASRAKEQMWLFHSVRPSDLGNPEDMRFRLLEYCYRERRPGEVGGSHVGQVPDDRQVEPFESLFEQRVFQRLHERGYTVLPQYETLGYRIDLVVVGARTRLAIECDGDFWHGPDAYQRDLARQRDLERCGWRLFRIRESEFYVDEAAVLERLWASFRELEIYPPGREPDTPS